MLYTIIKSLALISCSLVISQKAQDAAPPKAYHRYDLAINTSSHDFDKDDTLSFESPSHRGQISIVLINSEPVWFYYGDGHIAAINQHLHDGTNVIQFKTVAEIPIYVKIGDSVLDGDGWTLKSIAAKKEFVRLKGDAPPELSFNVAAPWLNKLPAREKLKVTPKDRETYEKEIAAVLEELREDVRLRRFENFAERILEGQRLYGAVAYGPRDDEKWRESVRRLAGRFEGKHVELVADQSKLIFVWGTQSVLVYHETPVPAHQGFPDFYAAIKLSVDGREDRISPLQFVRINGRWVIWDR